MKFLSKEINSLKSFVEENNLERKSAKWEITEDIKDIPFLGNIWHLIGWQYVCKIFPSFYTSISCFDYPSDLEVKNKTK
jgi:hypothetical protein